MFPAPLHLSPRRDQLDTRINWQILSFR